MGGVHKCTEVPVNERCTQRYWSHWEWVVYTKVLKSLWMDDVPKGTDGGVFVLVLLLMVPKDNNGYPEKQQQKPANRG